MVGHPSPARVDARASRFVRGTPARAEYTDAYRVGGFSLHFAARRLAAAVYYSCQPGTEAGRAGAADPRGRHLPGRIQDPTIRAEPCASVADQTWIAGTTADRETHPANAAPCHRRRAAAAADSGRAQTSAAAADSAITTQTKAGTIAAAATIGTGRSADRDNAGPAHPIAQSRTAGGRSADSAVTTQAKASTIAAATIGTCCSANRGSADPAHAIVQSRTAGGRSADSAATAQTEAGTIAAATIGTGCSADRGGADSAHPISQGRSAAGCRESCAGSAAAATSSAGTPPACTGCEGSAAPAIGVPGTDGIFVQWQSTNGRAADGTPSGTTPRHHRSIIRAGQRRI
jgi:hypothetical protein